MGLYHAKPEDRTSVFCRPIEEAYGALSPKLECQNEVKGEVIMGGDLPDFMKTCLDGVMVGNISKKELRDLL